MSGERGKLKVAIYSLIGIALVTACTVFVLKLIWDLWFPPFFKPVDRDVPKKIAQMRAMTDGIQPDNYTVAYREPNAESFSKRFHDWEIHIPKDTVSVCINCHGSMPHNNDNHTRAYLNKHGMHIGCETCHKERSERYAWYDISSGDVQNTKENATPLLVSAHKVTPVSAGQSNFSQPSLIAASGKFLREAEGLSSDERRQRLEEFHKGKVKEPLVCKSCHTATASASALPLETLGYTQFRIRQILNTEVVGMVTDYDVFYMMTVLPEQRRPLNYDDAPLTLEW